MLSCTGVSLVTVSSPKLTGAKRNFVSAREKTSGRRVAIKKIKVGQFKDGLDMSAIREVKYLRELSHPNVIEVRKMRILPSGTRQTRLPFCPRNAAPGRVFFKDEPESCLGVPGYGPGVDH